MSERRGSGRTGTAMQIERRRKRKPRSLRSAMKADELYSARMLRIKFKNRPMEGTQT